jgi:hypothetical protein
MARNKGRCSVFSKTRTLPENNLIRVAIVSICPNMVLRVAHPRLTEGASGSGPQAEQGAAPAGEFATLRAGDPENPPLGPRRMRSAASAVHDVTAMCWVRLMARGAPVAKSVCRSLTDRRALDICRARSRRARMGVARGVIPWDASW